MDLNARVLLICIVIAAANLCAGTAKGHATGEECKRTFCSYRLQGGSLDLRFGGNEIDCQSVDGRGEYRIGVPGETLLNFQGCREEITPFHFSCSDAHRPGREAEVRPMETSIRRVDADVIEIRWLNFRLDLACGGFLKIVIEGFWVGRLRGLGCGEPADSLALALKLLAHGSAGSSGIWDVYLDPRSDTYRLEPPWRMTISGEGLSKLGARKCALELKTKPQMQGNVRQGGDFRSYSAPDS